MRDATISVVIPVFNNADLIGRAMRSVAAQSFHDWELIVVDDGSTDASLQAAQTLAAEIESRLRVIGQEHGGSSSARNTGIAASRGRYVAFLDADDEFLPGKLARQMELLALRPELGLVYSDFAYVDFEGRRHPSVLDELAARFRPVPAREVAPGLFACNDDFHDLMTGHYVVSPITAIVRRDLLVENSIRFPVDQQYSEEWLFFLDVAQHCRAGFVGEALALHHHRAGSLSRTSSLRNNIQQAQAIERILAKYPHASRASRAEARAQLAACHRQMGFDHFKSRHYAAAAQHFRKSLVQGFRFRSAFHYVQALAASCTRGEMATAGPCSEAVP
jgi:hypothetical protein